MNQADAQSLLTSLVLNNVANQSCFDCRDPRALFSAVRFGVFICQRCAANHAAAGGDLEPAKPITGDVTWNEHELLAVQLGGNARARDHFDRGGVPLKAIEPMDVRQKYSTPTAQQYAKRLKYDCDIAFRRGVTLDITVNSTLRLDDLGSLQTIASPKFKENDMEGWLFKFSSGGTFRRRSFQRRYVVLKGGTLYFFKSPKNGSPYNSVATPGQLLVPVTDKKQPFCFELGDLRTSNTFLLSAENERDYQLWMGKLIQKGSAVLRDDGKLDGSATISMRQLTIGAVSRGRSRPGLQANTFSASASSAASSPASTPAATTPASPSASLSDDRAYTLAAADVTRAPSLTGQTVQVRRLDGKSPMADPICTACDTPILDDNAAFALGAKPFHVEHLCCDACLEPLSSVCYPHDGRAYCQLDYRMHFLPRCGDCGDTIADCTFVKAGAAGAYHDDHFRCCACTTPIAVGDTFVVRHGKPYCERDYTRLFFPICRICMAGIRGGSYVSVSDMENYHRECLVCAECGKQMGGAVDFSKKDRRYLCNEHRDT